MLHTTFQTFSGSKYANRFLELLLRALRVRILWYYFEVFGPGVQILRSSWTRGNYFRGVHLFCDRLSVLHLGRRSPIFADAAMVHVNWEEPNRAGLG